MNTELNTHNNTRLIEVDVAKAFAIIYMVVDHVYERMSVVDRVATLPDSALRNIIEFAGGPLSAPVFMFSMGIGMMYTRHNSHEDFMKRGFRLLIAGYILNFVRFTGPLMALKAMGVDADYGYSVLDTFFWVDIFQFAGLSFLLMGLLKKAHMKPFWIMCLALLMQASGTWLGMHMDQENPMNVFFGLFVYVGNTSGFALMLWFVYPAAGMLFAEIMKNVQDRDRFYKRILGLCVAVIISMISILPLIDYDIRNTYGVAGGIYYKQNMYSFLFTLSVVLIALALSYLVFHGREHTTIGRFIIYCSVNLTTIFVIQWLLIIYGFLFMMIIGSASISLEAVIPVGLIITAASIGLSVLWNKMERAAVGTS